MPLVTVVRANALRTPEQRAGVVYVGRAFAGWPRSRWCNPFSVTTSGSLATCLWQFRRHMMAQPPEWWSDLWAACRQGELSLACWCFTGEAEAGVAVCHAAILGAELSRRFADAEGSGS